MNEDNSLVELLLVGQAREVALTIVTPGSNSEREVTLTWRLCPLTGRNPA